MKNLIIIFFITVISTKSYSQIEENKWSSHFYGGVAIGPETGLGLPKADAWAEFGNNKRAIFFGGGGSFWFIFVGFYSLNFNTGYRYKKLRLENAISYWRLPSQDGGTGIFSPRSSHYAYNPKIGLQFKNIIFRIGPSFTFKENYENYDELPLFHFTKIKNVRFNLEFVGNIRN